jgi:hypothetical protein
MRCRAAKKHANASSAEEAPLPQIIPSNHSSLSPRAQIQLPPPSPISRIVFPPVSASRKAHCASSTTAPNPLPPPQIQQLPPARMRKPMPRLHQSAAAPPARASPLGADCQVNLPGESWGDGS